MNIGLKIRRIRLQKGYSQEYMADFLKISQKTYSHLENEKIKIHLGRLIQIAAIFELSLVEMIGPETQKESKTIENTQLNKTLLSFNRQLQELREEIRLLRIESTVA